MKAFIVATVVLAGLVSTCMGGARSYFAPYGPANGDDTLYRNDDEFTGAVTLIGGMNFFGSVRQTLYVDNNGIITLDQTSWIYTPESLDILTVATIAPYWADVDTRPANGGYVYYRSTLDPTLCASVSSFVRATQVGSNFVGTRAFVATWENVGYYNQRTNKFCTFQCVLIADDLGATFAIFNYGDMQWTTGDASGGSNGLGGVPAAVGFAKGSGGVYSQLADSLTGNIINVGSGTNAYINGVPQTGQYVFAVSDGVTISTCCSTSNPPVLSGTPSQLAYTVNTINDVPAFTGTVTATSQCTSPVTQTITPVVFSVYGCPVTRTWTATDACFKSTSVQQVFTYPQVFSTPLQMTVPADYSAGGNCNSPVAPDPSVSGQATTNRGADGTVTYTDSTWTLNGQTCTLTRYWIAKDICNTYQYGSQDITLSNAPITSNAVTSHAVTSQAVTSHAVTSQPLTTQPLTTQPLTTQPLTTQPLTTQPLTTQPLTTQPLTTQELTTQPLTTQELTTQELTTQPLTTQELTTQPLTTQPLTTKPLTTQPLTTTFVSVAARCLTYSWPETQGFFCSADQSGYYQCLKGPWAAQAAFQRCPAGTSCKCAVGVECSSAGICTRN